MKVEITVVLDNGKRLSGSINLVEEVGNNDVPASAVTSVVAPPVLSENENQIDYSLPVRPFMVQYADNMSGSKKFALLVAYFAKGEVDNEVDRSLVVETWSKMVGLLGGKFNGAHESRAKDSGWIYVSDNKKLALLKNWKGIFNDGKR